MASASCDIEELGCRFNSSRWSGCRDNAESDLCSGTPCLRTPVAAKYLAAQSASCSAIRSMSPWMASKRSCSRSAAALRTVWQHCDGYQSKGVRCHAEVYTTPGGRNGSSVAAWGGKTRSGRRRPFTLLYFRRDRGGRTAARWGRQRPRCRQGAPPHPRGAGTRRRRRSPGTPAGNQHMPLRSVCARVLGTAQVLLCWECGPTQAWAQGQLLHSSTAPTSATKDDVPETSKAREVARWPLLRFGAGTHRELANALRKLLAQYLGGGLALGGDQDAAPRGEVVADHVCDGLRLACTRRPNEDGAALALERALQRGQQRQRSTQTAKAALPRVPCLPSATAMKPIPCVTKSTLQCACALPEQVAGTCTCRGGGLHAPQPPLVPCCRAVQSTGTSIPFPLPPPQLRPHHREKNVPRTRKSRRWLHRGPRAALCKQK